MQFDLEKSLEILERTPDTLTSLLTGLSPEWLRNNEGENTWSAYDVMGHLIHGEKTDWMVRVRKVLSEHGNKTFEPFDRFAQMNLPQDRPMEDLLEEFKDLRTANLSALRKLKISESFYTHKGIHPNFGEVSLSQLLSTWTVHDLGHIGQIVRVMSKQYKEEVGPWKEFLRILH